MYETYNLKAIIHCLTVYCRVCTTMTNHYLPRDANKTFSLTSSPNCRKRAAQPEHTTESK